MKLTKENEKIMRKAKRYIRTFPLSTEEIRQIEEDITGMALESQERGEDFMEVIGKPIRDLAAENYCESAESIFSFMDFSQSQWDWWLYLVVFLRRKLFIIIYLQLMLSLWDIMPNMAVIHQKREIKSLHLDLFSSYS